MFYFSSTFLLISVDVWRRDDEKLEQVAKQTKWRKFSIRFDLPIDRPFLRRRPFDVRRKKWDRRRESLNSKLERDVSLLKEKMYRNDRANDCPSLWRARNRRLNEFFVDIRKEKKKKTEKPSSDLDFFLSSIMAEINVSTVEAIWWKTFRCEASKNLKKHLKTKNVKSWETFSLVRFVNDWEYLWKISLKTNVEKNDFDGNEDFLEYWTTINAFI